MSSKTLYIAPYAVPEATVQPLFNVIPRYLKEPSLGCADEYTDIVRAKHLRVLHLLTAGVTRFQEKARLIVTKESLRGLDVDSTQFDAAIGVVLSGSGAVINGNYTRAGDVSAGSVWVRSLNRAFGLKSADDKPLVYLELLIQTPLSLRLTNDAVEQNLLTLF